MKVRVLIWCFCLGVPLGWAIFAHSFLPGIVGRAYHQQSLPFINDMIHGRNEFTLEQYQQKAKSRAWLVMACVSSVALSIAFTTNPTFNRLLYRIAPCRRPIQSPHWCSTQRRIAILSLIILLPTVQLVAGIVQYDAWPFLAYNMFNGIRSNTSREYRIYGVSVDQAFPIGDVVGALPYRITGQDMAGALRTGRAALILDDLLDRYEERRIARLHTGPQLTEIRLYCIGFTFSRTDPYAKIETRREVVSTSRPRSR